MKHLSIRSLAFAIALTSSIAATATAQEKSLDKCQKAAAKESASHVKARTKAIAKCLQKISGALIKSGASDPAGAAKACAGSLRKLVNTADANKTVSAKAKTKMRKACDPAVASLAHSVEQVLSLTPSGVAEGLQAANLDAYCSVFGGDGSLDTVEEWADCQIVASRCEANQQISVQYPRALEWLAAVRPHIVALGGDAKYTDAVTALDEIDAALDGDHDNALDINCGPGNTVCGDGVIDANEECDSANLAGETCESVGFPDGGTLACKGNCGFNYQGCFSSTMAKTGQTVTFINDDDGDLEIGPPFSYIDNGDGTFTDTNTGLTWEKISDDGSIHDQNNGYTWSDAFNVKIAALNTMPCFANHCDWRLPNLNELRSLLDLGSNNPALRPQLGSGCTLGCNGISCSCSPPTPFWSSTTRDGAIGNKWFINFLHGHTTFSSDGINRAVRAVRGPE
ncbi:MAG TPA: DUF1566 domain-containing protein [Terriglobales bacterium]|nr:DUF1566 domain-containing protein [Terriglobales bacterium]